MNSFLDQLFRDQDPHLFGAADVVLAMTVSALLAYVLATAYRATHRGTSYSRAYVHTLFLMAVITAVIMMIIGSNIARAFSLVGALSIIRFRTAVKDARDTGFLFAAMAAGMACGTQFYMPGILLTAFVSGLMLLLDFAEFGRKTRPDGIVRVTFKKGDRILSQIEADLRAAFRETRLLNRLLDFEENHQTHVYAVRLAGAQAIGELEARLQALDDVVQVAVYERDQHEGDE